MPLLWMSLFQPSDLKTGWLPSIEDNQRVEIPVVHRRFAAKRLATVVPILMRTFPHVATWQIHADLLEKAINRAAAKRPYLSIDWTQIEALTLRRDFSKESKWLMRYLAGQRVTLPAERLKEFTNICWDRRFPDPLSGDLSDKDEKNLAAILGNACERNVPWWPSVSRRRREEKKPKGGKRSGASGSKTRTNKVAARATGAELHDLLRSAVRNRSEVELNKLLRGVEDLSAPKFTELLDDATRNQRWNATTKIPNRLLAHGVRVSPNALAEVAVNGTAAQLEAMLQRGGINLSKRIKAKGYSNSAPAISWIVFDQDRKKATQKLKLFLAAGASVDVKCSGGEWMLIESIGEPWAKLLIPKASRKHRLEALKHVMEYRFAAEVDESRVEAGIKNFLVFVRALHRSGIAEARGREAEIRKKREADARRSPLEPYPFR